LNPFLDRQFGRIVADHQEAGLACLIPGESDLREEREEKDQCTTPNVESDFHGPNTKGSTV
jgi:hypothetical protein